jgi:hypothetical protein
MQTSEVRRVDYLEPRISHFDARKYIFGNISLPLAKLTVPHFQSKIYPLTAYLKSDNLLQDTLSAR